MKKTLVCLLIGILTLTAFTACGGDQSDTSSGNSTTQGSDSAVTTTTVTTTTDGGNDQTPEHVHTAGEAWQVDKDNHWHVCECGENMDSAAHTVKDDVCTVCESELYTYHDGSLTIYQYNENGDCVLSIDYDEDGKETARQIGEYTYDEDGNPLTEKQYTDGELTYECEYKLDAEGYPYPSNEIVYHEDGSKIVYQYDENYELLSEVWYNADGSMMDNSDKFDAEACKDLIGTWKSELDMTEFIPYEELDDSFKITVMMTLTDKGEISMTMEIDEDEFLDFMYQMTIDSIYASLEEEGLSRDLADAVFKAQMGMTIPEYVESILDETDINDLFGEIPEGFTGVYYMEDGVIYAGDSWNQPLEGASFTLEGDTLTLETDDEEYSDMEVIFTKVID